MQRNNSIFWVVLATLSLSVATWVEGQSRPPNRNQTEPIPGFEDRQPRWINVFYEQQPGPATVARIQRLTSSLQAWLPQLCLKFRTVTTVGQHPGITIMISTRSPVSGRTGRTKRGDLISIINPYLADDWTLPDEIAHQMRGHADVPRLPPALFILDIVVNCYMDLGNVAWLYAWKYAA